MAIKTLAGIYDDAGRYLAPLPSAAPVRPAGPWDTNARIASEAA